MTRVLLLEDEPSIREAYIQVLGLEGYQVVECGNGKEGIAALEAGGVFDLIILDLAMPVLSGFGFLRWLESSVHHALPVLVVSAGAEKPESRIGLRFLSKPTTVDELLSEVALCAEPAG